jgi:hypothetical protein
MPPLRARIARKKRYTLPSGPRGDSAAGVERHQGGETPDRSDEMRRGYDYGQNLRQPAPYGRYPNGAPRPRPATNPNGWNSPREALPQTRRRWRRA